MTDPFDRRTFMLAGAASTSLLLLPAASRAAAAKPKMTTYRSPSCGCCAEWIEKARAAGFAVTVVPTDDIYALKAKHGVPEELISCHTSLIGGYVVEGHVPFDAVKRLLTRRPEVKGIAVAGMPVGSPGMEAPDGRKQPFKVMAFDATGKISSF
jgi:hypothetical protein